MVINVTQAHIDAGVPRHCMHCMLGKAIHDDLLLYCEYWESMRIIDWSVLVYDFYIEWIDKEDVKHTATIGLPTEAVELAKMFDAGYKAQVQPFSFELPIDELLNG